jgi:hypothetical protein
MTIPKIIEVLNIGDTKGSALKELAEFYHCDNYDLSPINDAMADRWLHRDDSNNDDRYEWEWGD